MGESGNIFSELERRKFLPVFIVKWLSASASMNELEIFDAYPEEYEELVSLFLQRKEIGKAVGRIIEEHFKGRHAPMFALDTACGTGLITSAVEPHIAPDGRVVGFDVSRRMLDYAKKTKRQRIEWRENSFEDLRGIPDGSVDVYTMVAAYRFVRKHRTFLSEMARALAPGGIGILPRSKRNISDYRMRWMRKTVAELNLNMEVRPSDFKSAFQRMRCPEMLIFTKE